MDNFRINHRYATALFDFAEERNEVEQTYEDVNTLADAINQNRELKLLLKSPVIFTDKKLKIIDMIFKGKIGKVTQTFIEILVKKRREEYLPGIAKAYIDLYRESKGIKLAQITSAIPLDDNLRNQLISLLAKQTGAIIILEEHVDPEIIGGLIVKIEGVKFDDSIRKKITDLKQEFNVNTYIKGF